MHDSFWQGKKVLVTGHTGFKGSWLSLYLQSLGATVIGYALPAPTQPNLFELAALKNNMHSHEADIRDFDTLHKFINKEKPEIVFHLAAQALVRHSYDNPIETYSTNVMGTVNLLEALRQTDCARVAVNVTSDKCYDNHESLTGYRETEAMGGYDPYSSSKACAELVTSAYRQSYFNEQEPLFLASARAGNVIGGGDWAKDRLIPDFLRAIMSNTPLKIRNPNSIRPWQHVLEPLNGYLTLAQHLWTEGKVFTGAWNFGPDDQDAKTVEWIANHLTQLWGEGSSWELDREPNLLHETSYLKLDIRKARSNLNWNPRWNLEKALASTVAWYKTYKEKLNIRELMLGQIVEYQAS